MWPTKMGPNACRLYSLGSTFHFHLLWRTFWESFCWKSFENRHTCNLYQINQKKIWTIYNINILGSQESSYPWLFHCFMSNAWIFGNHETSKGFILPSGGKCLQMPKHDTPSPPQTCPTLCWSPLFGVKFESWSYIWGCTNLLFKVASW